MKNINLDKDPNGANIFQTVKMTYANPFMRKIKTVDPELFMSSQGNGSYSKYGTKCQWTIEDSQLLTQQEKDRIDRE